ncbi:hypothetical protein GCM10008994_10710 [Halorubrum ejinorense]|uniref:Uncharacterized protein n=1 Tax=Halorubrum ejinorense TaxID=425309 RepID=A0AAV3SRE6_9EURY
MSAPSDGPDAKHGDGSPVRGRVRPETGGVRADKNTLKTPDGDRRNGNSTAADPTRRGSFARGLGM